MKIVIEPKQEEKVECYSDFSGDRFEYDIPEVELKFNFNYGSKFDDATLELHLSDTEAMEILETIKYKLCQNTKEKLHQKLESIQKNYDDSIDARSWECCDYYGNNIEMYRFILGIQEDLE